MKCAKCGADLNVGSVYCANCGESAQIVPDYNLLEDEFIVSILDEKKKDVTPLPKDMTAKKNKIKLTKKQCFCLGIGVSIVVILVLLIFLNTSYSHYINKGMDFDKKEAYDEAVVYYEKAINKDEKKTKAYVLAANDYMLLEDYIKAETYYLKALELDDKNISAYRGILSLYVFLGDYSSIDNLKSKTTNEKILAVFDSAVIAPPVFSQNGDKYNDDVEVMLTSDAGDAIYYTTDGRDPTKGNYGVRYQDPIVLTEGTTTLKAVCRSQEGSWGQVATEKYKITYEKPEIPTIEPEGGSFSSPTNITIFVPEGSRVFYTWDGTTPTETSAQYTKPIPVLEGNNILSVILIDKHGKQSNVEQFNYKYIP